VGALKRPKARYLNPRMGGRILGTPGISFIRLREKGGKGVYKGGAGPETNPDCEKGASG